MRTFLTIAAGALVLALMPAPPESERAQIETSLVTKELVNAAQEAAPLVTLCSAKPVVCESAAHAAESLEAKARFGAHVIIEWANTASGRVLAKLPADLA